jgi:hypothetical protein
MDAWHETVMADLMEKARRTRSLLEAALAEAEEFQRSAT